MSELKFTSGEVSSLCLVIPDFETGIPLVLSSTGACLSWSPESTERTKPGSPHTQWLRSSQVNGTLSKKSDLTGTVHIHRKKVGVIMRAQRSESGYLRLRVGGVVTEDLHTVQQLCLAVFAGQFGMNTLVVGESGTGKEEIARIVHNARSRNGTCPWVALNVGALSEALCLSELFGHERGSYTGADRTRTGSLRGARDGVVFLDELDSTGPVVQVALLRALEERAVRAVGADVLVPIHCQVVASVQLCPEKPAGAWGIRADLMHRLAAMVIRLRPLRERPADILGLAAEFIADETEPWGGRKGLSPGARQLLLNHSWPGNIRELKQVLCRASVIEPGSMLSESSLRWAIQVLEVESVPVEQWMGQSSLDQEILKLSVMTPGARGRGRRVLGISKSTFYRRLKGLRLERDRSLSGCMEPSLD